VKFGRHFQRFLLGKEDWNLTDICETFLISKQGWNFDTYCCLLRLLYLPEDGEKTKSCPVKKLGTVFSNLFKHN
jgi:hypothetical protein